MYENWSTNKLKEGQANVQKYKPMLQAFFDFLENVKRKQQKFAENLLIKFPEKSWI